MTVRLARNKKKRGWECVRLRARGPDTGADVAGSPAWPRRRSADLGRGRSRRKASAPHAENFLRFSRVSSFCRVLGTGPRSVGGAPGDRRRLRSNAGPGAPGMELRPGENWGADTSWRTGAYSLFSALTRLPVSTNRALFKRRRQVRALLFNCSSETVQCKV